MYEPLLRDIMAAAVRLIEAGDVVIFDIERFDAMVRPLMSLQQWQSLDDDSESAAVRLAERVVRLFDLLEPKDLEC